MKEKLKETAQKIYTEAWQEGYISALEGIRESIKIVNEPVLFTEDYIDSMIEACKLGKNLGINNFREIITPAGNIPTNSGHDR